MLKFLLNMTRDIFVDYLCALLMNNTQQTRSYRLIWWGSPAVNRSTLTNDILADVILSLTRRCHGSDDMSEWPPRGAHSLAELFAVDLFSENRLIYISILTSLTWTVVRLNRKITSLMRKKLSKNHFRFPFTILELCRIQQNRLRGGPGTLI